jgi:hypothetical protein
MELVEPFAIGAKRRARSGSAGWRRQSQPGRARGASRVLAAAAVIFLAAPLAIPQTVKDVLDVNRASLEAQRRVLVAGAVPLTDAEGTAFWPLYDAYEKERRALDERENQLVADFVATAASLSDSQAKAMLGEALKVSQQRLSLRSSFLERMGKTIPPRKLVSFFQIDNKLDAGVRADIARQIPLVP